MCIRDRLYLAEIENLFADKIAKTAFDVLECFVFIKVLSQVIFSSQPNILHRILLGSIRREQEAGDLPILLF